MNIVISINSKIPKVNKTWFSGVWSDRKEGVGSFAGADWQTDLHWRGSVACHPQSRNGWPPLKLIFPIFSFLTWKMAFRSFWKFISTIHWNWVILNFFISIYILWVISIFFFCGIIFNINKYDFPYRWYCLAKDPVAGQRKQWPPLKLRLWTFSISHYWMCQSLPLAVAPWFYFLFRSFPIRQLRYWLWKVLMHFLGYPKQK